MGEVARNTLKGMRWTAFGALSGKLVQFAIGIVLARLLSPADFGIVGMTTFLFTLTYVITDSGLCVALVRKPDLTDADKSTIFFFNVAASTACCILLCLFAESIAAFLNAPVLANIIRALSVSMLIGSFAGVHWALCQREVDFKTPALVDLCAQLATGAVAIFLAYRGFGPWALVVQGVLFSLIRAVAIWRILPWRPSCAFSWESFRSLFGFSGSLAVNNLIDCFYSDGVGMLIGKFHTPAQLGYYAKGQSLARLPSTFMFDIVGRVLLPVMSKIQDEDARLMLVTRRFMRTLSMAVFFPMLLLVVLAKPIVVLLYTEKWLPAVPFLQVFGLVFMIYHIHAVNWNLLLVKGRSDWALRKELVNKAVNLSLVAAAIPFGPIWIGCACLAGSCICLFVNAWVARRLFGYGLVLQAQDTVGYLALGALSTLPAVLAVLFGLGPCTAIVAGGLLSAAVYFAILFCRQDENLMQILAMALNRKGVPA